MGTVIRYASYGDYVEDRPIRPPRVQKILERACLTAKECEALAVVEQKGELTRDGREQAAIVVGIVGALGGLAISVLAAAMIHPILLASAGVLMAIGGLGGAALVLESEDDA